MDRVFGMDSPVMAALNKIVNLIILNLSFLISSIPVITAGAALTALYSVNLKMVKGEESYVFREYRKEFARNFRQSTVCWMVFLCAGAVFVMDLKAVRIFDGALKWLFLITTFGVGIVLLVIFLYVFPYMARFQDRLGVCFKNALLIGAGRFGYTISMLLIAAAAIAVSICNVEIMLEALFVWLVIGFSLLSYVNSYFFRIVFLRYED